MDRVLVDYHAARTVHRFYRKILFIDLGRIHVFPVIFPEMPPAGPRQLPLQKVVNTMARTGKKGAYTALVFALVMVVFARPKFNVSLSTMNTVSKETIAAEKERMLATTWWMPKTDENKLKDPKSTTAPMVPTQANLKNRIRS